MSLTKIIFLPLIIGFLIGFIFFINGFLAAGEEITKTVDTAVKPIITPEEKAEITALTAKYKSGTLNYGEAVKYIKMLNLNVKKVVNFSNKSFLEVMNSELEAKIK